MARYQKLSDELIVPNLNQDISFFYDPTTKKLRKQFEIYPEALQANVKFANDLERTHIELLKRIQAERRRNRQHEPNNPNPNLCASLVHLRSEVRVGRKYPAPTETTLRFAISNLRQAKPAELRLHYRTLGKPERCAGQTTNAVLIVHGCNGGAPIYSLVANFGKISHLTTKFYRVAGRHWSRQIGKADGSMQNSRVTDISTWLKRSTPANGGLGVDHTRWSWEHRWAAAAVGRAASRFHVDAIIRCELPTQSRAQSHSADSYRRHRNDRPGTAAISATAEPALPPRSLVHERQSGVASEGRAYSRENG
jgi:hypothetical protein